MKNNNKKLKLSQIKLFRLKLFNIQFKKILLQNVRRNILKIIIIPVDLRLLTSLYKLTINNKLLKKLIL